MKASEDDEMGDSSAKKGGRVPSGLVPRFPFGHNPTWRVTKRREQWGAGAFQTKRKEIELSREVDDVTPFNEISEGYETEQETSRQTHV